MEYKIGDIFYDADLCKKVECVADENQCSCECCAYNDEGVSCPAKSYDRHPCYFIDRQDGKNVHFVVV